MRIAIPMLLLTWLLTSCVSVPDVAYWSEHAAEPIDRQHKSERMIIEVSDKGPIFHAGQFERLQKWLESAPDDMPVVVFINGWHHNASKADQNLKDFHTFIAMVEDAAGTSVQGLYVGWRGDSADTIIPWEPSDFLTVWGRENASVTVGENGLRQILDYLRAHHQNRRVFVVGHSFGGSALFHAIKHQLPNETNDGFEYIMLNPAVAEREFDQVKQALLTAHAERLRPDNEAPRLAQVALERSFRKVTVLQSLGDRAVGIAYRIAFLTTPIGFDKGRRTHHAWVCGERKPCPEPPEPSCTSTLSGGKFIIETRPPAGSTCQAVNDLPVWVITGEDSVSANHNDILNSVQANALAELVAARIRASLMQSAPL